MDPFDWARRRGLVRWPPYMGRFVGNPGGAPAGLFFERLRTELAEWKHALGYNLGHLLPQAGVFALEEAITAAYLRRGLGGDYAEFGVFSGRSMIRAWHYMQAVRPGGPGRMFAFDSFQGLPDLEAADRVRYADFAAGAYACSEEDFRRNLESFGIPRDKVVTVPGWFDDTCNPDTAARIGLGKLAVVHIDCDILSATLTVLRFVADHLEDGAIVVFDDYGSYRAHPQLGQRGALARWRAERPDLLVEPVRVEAAGSASFSVHRRLSDQEAKALGGG